MAAELNRDAGLSGFRDSELGGARRRAPSVSGFPVALALAWTFEITPEGIKLESEVSPNESSRVACSNSCFFGHE